jgi:CubicO group peptidase (beta-lactamase class C family)
MNMSELKRLTMILPLTAIAVIAGFGSWAADRDNSALDTIAPIVKALPDRIIATVENDRLVSISMAVVHEGEIIFSQAFGHANLEEQRPATPRTIYPMASITKVFTATMLAHLAEQRVVSLEDPVQKYVPEYQPRSPFPGTLPTTLRQLATHTSGLPKDAPLNFWCNFSGFAWIVTGGQTEMSWFVPCDSLLKSLGEIELVHPPEVFAHYSNLNIQILGMAMERACGEPFQTYMEAEILAPLGMKDTRFALDAEQHKRLATGYVYTGPTVPPLKAPEYVLGCATYSGGLFTTSEDLARFIISVLEEDRADDLHILETGTLRRMRTPQSIHQPGVHPCHGLGWGVVKIDGHHAIEHNGALLGYHAHVSAIPDLGLGIVALSNTKNYLWRPDSCKELARAVLTDLADALVAASHDVVFDPAAMDFGSFEGIYVLPGDVAHMEVLAIEGGLSVTLTDIPDFSEKFAPVGPKTFCFTADPGHKPMLFFKTDSDGEITAVTFLSHTFNRINTLTY